MKQGKTIVSSLYSLVFAAGIFLFAGPSTPAELEKPAVTPADRRGDATGKTVVPAPEKPGKTVNGMTRIISPVRLSSELGDVLSSDVEKTREILERFEKSGFHSAIWAVDTLPAKDEDIKPWVDACLKAFPYKPIVTIDDTLGKPLDAGTLKTFLAVSLPRAQSVLVNYTRLSNCSCGERLKDAMALVKRDMDLARSVSQKTFVWLLVDDCAKGQKNAADWLAVLEENVNGYFIYASHDWNAGMNNECAGIEAIGAKGKRAIRAGFHYVCPTVRPGIDKEIAEHYSARMKVYETWVSRNRYEGYSRDIGERISEGLDSNMSYPVFDVSQAGKPRTER